MNQDISQILNFFSRSQSQDIQNKGAKTADQNFGIFYGNESPDELYRQMTYTSAPTQVTVQRTQPQAPVMSKEIDATTDISNNNHFFSQKKNNMNNPNNRQTASSPYDFKQSSEFQPDMNMKQICTFDSQLLQNATISEPPKIETITVSGKTSVFNTKLIGIRSNVKHNLPSVVNERSNINSTEDDINGLENDPIIKEIASTRPTSTPLRVFASAKVLAAVAVCQRSIFPFDLIFNRKEGTDMYVGVRNSVNNSGSNFNFSLAETNMETFMTTEPMTTMRDKATAEFFQNILETTTVNEEFKKKVIEDMPEIDFSKKAISTNVNNTNNDDNSGICADGNGETKKSYIYRSILFEDLEIIVRGEIEAVQEKAVTSNRRVSAPIQRQPQTQTQNQTQAQTEVETQVQKHDYIQLPPNLSICVCRVLNDIPSRFLPKKSSSSWETNLDRYRGTIFLNETTNNSAKVARWVSLAKLLGAETVMVGYAVRKSPSSREPHVLLGVEKHNTEKFALDISLKESNMYGLLHEILTRMTKLPPSPDYAFIKEVRMKKTFSIYSSIDTAVIDQWKQLQISMEASKMETEDI